jgi:hypothetical protein
MLDSRYIIIPFVLQVACMGVDELYFHRQRALPRWERLGHPLDTLMALLCLFWIWFVPPASHAIAIYAALALFSSFIITKDEWVHQRHCAAGEHWLHAVLFVLHPLVLLGAALLWPAAHEQPSPWLHFTGWERTFLLANMTLMGWFGLYQFVYWNLLWKFRK